MYAPYPGVGVFRYSPTFAILMTPFAMLGNRLGGLAWAWANVGLYVYAIRRLARDVLPGFATAKPGKWSESAVALLLLLSLPASVRALWNSQAHPVTTAMVLLAAAAMSRERWWLAAALLAVATYAKLSPLAIAGLLVAMYPRQMTGRFALMLLAGAALPFLTQRWPVVLDQYAGWHECLTQTAEQRWVSERDARTIWQLATGDLPSQRWYHALQAAAALAALGWTQLQSRRGDARRAIALALAAGTAYILLLGPAVEFPGYAALAPFSAWALIEAGRRRIALLLIGASYVLTGVLGFGAIERLLLHVFRFAPAALPTGTILFATWLLVYARRTRAAPAAPARQLELHAAPADTKKPESVDRSDP